MQYQEDTMIAFVVISLFLHTQTTQSRESFIEVANGGQWGKWGSLEKCPPGTVAKGFDLKVEYYQGLGDDTALNGIRLHCVTCKYPHKETNITSAVQRWGTWTPSIWCPLGFLQSFSLKVEPNQGTLDDTAANNIKFKCSDGTELEGHGLIYGSYSRWSEDCKYGICGIMSKVEESQGNGDDTALNDVKFICCNYPTESEEQQTQQTQSLDPKTQQSQSQEQNTKQHQYQKKEQK